MWTETQISSGPKINQLRGRNPPKQYVFSNDRSIYDEQETTNVLAAHFASVSATSSYPSSFLPHKIEQENSPISFFPIVQANNESWRKKFEHLCAPREKSVL